MKKILVTYATMAGSTAEVAQAIREAIAGPSLQVDISPLHEVRDITGYQGVIIGAPMIMGWHRQALRFLRKHRDVLERTPFAIFVMAMSLTDTGETRASELPVFVDENLPKPPLIVGKLSFRERYARIDSYLRPILKAARPARPASIGVFGGRLEYGRLKWWAVLFAMLIIQARAGDRRNWEAIRSWAAGLPFV